MANPLPPIPLKTPIADDNGLPTGPWTAWFRELFSRVGGTNASSNSQLFALISTIQTNISSLQTEVEGLKQGRQL